MSLPESTWRLVALLALVGHPVRRQRAADVLWPDAAGERALGNLRSCLWRVRKVAPGLLGGRLDPLELGPSVRVDLTELSSLAGRLESGAAVDAAALEACVCGADLLPEFSDDFVDGQRELVRQLCLRTLELAARRLLESGSPGAALRLALVAVSRAPLRESAHELVLQAHLAEGNLSEAMRHFRALNRLLAAELGIVPSGRIRAVMAGSAADERVVPAAERA